MQALLRLVCWPPPSLVLPGINTLLSCCLAALRAAAGPPAVLPHSDDEDDDCAPGEGAPDGSQVVCLLDAHACEDGYKWRK